MHVIVLAESWMNRFIFVFIPGIALLHGVHFSSGLDAGTLICSPHISCAIAGLLSIASARFRVTLQLCCTTKKCVDRPVAPMETP